MDFVYRRPVKKMAHSRTSKLTIRLFPEMMKLKMSRAVHYERAELILLIALKTHPFAYLSGYSPA
jgi:hypothetical protein